MIQNVLHTIGGIANYGIVSLCLFVGAFAIILARACLLKRPALEQMARLPLDPEINHATDPSLHE